MADTTTNGSNGHAAGRVVRVIGPVVDVEFPPGQLPEINTAVRIDVAARRADDDDHVRGGPAHRRQSGPDRSR